MKINFKINLKKIKNKKVFKNKKQKIKENVLLFEFYTITPNPNVFGIINLFNFISIIILKY